MRILLNIIFVLGVCFSISSCFPSCPIYVKNSTSDTVYWFYTASNKTIESSEIKYWSLLKLPPYTTEYLEDFYEFEEYSADYLIVFFFNKDTVDKYGEKYVVENNLYAKRCVADANDLKKMNYIIVYPYDRK